MLFYCRGTVEKYIFAKLHEFLFAMYAHKNEAEDVLFTQRSLQIKQMKPQKVMEYLGINEKFIIGNQWRTRTDSSMDDPESARSQPGASDDRSKVPYIEAIREIEKI